MNATSVFHYDFFYAWSALDVLFKTMIFAYFTVK